MKFKITFVYMDGKEFSVEVTADRMEAFIAALGKNEVFFNDCSGIGIFIPADKIRYFHVERQDEKGRRIITSNTELPDGDGSVENREAQPNEKGDGGVGKTVQVPRSYSQPSENNQGTEREV
jgi:hypothetical protein